MHVNGYVRNGDGLCMWVGRRSPDKHVAPNKLDQLVAGGRSAPYSVLETVLKEAEEEAGIDAALASRAVPVGVISYRTVQRGCAATFFISTTWSCWPTSRRSTTARSLTLSCGRSSG
ncbi:MAG: hypothetical protein U1E43_07450 [Rhodospirillales bacterium]